MLIEIKMANRPATRIERFVQILVRDTLGEVRASAQNEAHLTEFNVAIG